MAIVNNLQKLVSISVSQLVLDTKLLMRIAGYETFDVGVMLVNNHSIHELNMKYRGVDEVTDVLAFPYHDEISEENAGKLPDVCEEERMLGDIVLGVPYIHTESQRHGTDFKSDLLTQISHGMFHLVGYDHQTKGQWAKMYRRELETLTKFNSMTGYRCKPLLSVGHYSPSC